MQIVVLKESSADEFRVALVPESVKKLVAAGNKISGEAGAGLLAGASDADYEQAGAEIFSSQAEMLQKAGVLLAINFIYAPTNLAATIPVHASQLFSRNLTTFCNLPAKDGALNLDFSDDILDGSCVAHQGEIRHERIKTNYKLRING